MYSIKPILHHYSNTEGLHAVIFQVCHRRIKVYPPIGVKILKTQWKNFQVVAHPQREKMNALVAQKKNLYEGRLLEAMKVKSEFTKDELLEILTGRKIKPILTFSSFASSYIDEVKDRLSAGRIRHYNVVLRKILSFDEKAQLSNINGAWLLKFENWLNKSGIQATTINSNMAIIKKIVRAAKARKLINEADFEGYARLKEQSHEPDFLTEDELQAFFAVARAINKPGHKLAAYYFLLSCFTGLRLGDAKKFNYSTHVQGNEIIVRATKNKKLITVPLYADLSEVLDYIQDKPFLLSEQKARLYVKEIASLAGIKKRVKYHSSRHTAASLFLSKGLSLTETASIIGDTPAVAKIYAHIDKQKLNEKIRRVMG